MVSIISGISGAISSGASPEGGEEDADDGLSIEIFTCSAWADRLGATSSKGANSSKCGCLGNHENKETIRFNIDREWVAKRRFLCEE